MESIQSSTEIVYRRLFEPTVKYSPCITTGWIVFRGADIHTLTQTRRNAVSAVSISLHVKRYEEGKETLFKTWHKNNNNNHFGIYGFDSCWQLPWIDVIALLFLRCIFDPSDTYCKQNKVLPQTHTHTHTCEYKHTLRRRLQKKNSLNLLIHLQFFLKIAFC